MFVRRSTSRVCVCVSWRPSWKMPRRRRQRRGSFGSTARSTPNSWRQSWRPSRSEDTYTHTPTPVLTHPLSSARLSPPPLLPVHTHFQLVLLSAFYSPLSTLLTFLTTLYLFSSSHISPTSPCPTTLLTKGDFLLSLLIFSPVVCCCGPVLLLAMASGITDGPQSMRRREGRGVLNHGYISPQPGQAARVDQEGPLCSRRF